MQFTIQQSTLVTALLAIQFAVSTRLPLLMNVRITVRKSEVVFAATDLKVYAEYIAPCGDVCESGDTTVSHKELLALVRPLKGETITFQASSKLTITSESIATTLNVVDAHDFPLGPRSCIQPVHSQWSYLDQGGKVEKGIVLAYKKEEITLNVADFHRALSLVGYGASTDNSRPVMTGLYMEAKNSQLFLTTADNSRLCHMAVPATGSWSGAALPPAKSVIRAFKKAPRNGELTISVECAQSKSLDDDNLTKWTGPYLFFRVGPLEIVSLLIKGSYPNVRSLIPKSGEMITATLSAESLQRALAAVKAIASASSNMVLLRFNNGITIKARRDGMDRPMVIAVKADTSGKDLEVIYHWKHLNDVLAVSPKSTITLRVASFGKVGTIELTDVPGFLTVFWPMHLNANRWFLDPGENEVSILKSKETR